MFVRLAIGRQAGSVVDMPYAAGQSCLAMGTATAATDAEIVAAGFEPARVPLEAAPETLPPGYEAASCEGGGFDVFGPDGVRINNEPFRNLAAARAAGLRHLEVAAAAVALAALPVAIPDEWRNLPKADLLALAKAFAPAARTRDESIAAIETELAARQAAAV